MSVSTYWAGVFAAESTPGVGLSLNRTKMLSAGPRAISTSVLPSSLGRATALATEPSSAFHSSTTAARARNVAAKRLKASERLATK